jgi:hypothetical protein
MRVNGAGQMGSKENSGADTIHQAVWLSNNGLYLCLDLDGIFKLGDRLP